MQRQPFLRFSARRSNRLCFIGSLGLCLGCFLWMLTSMAFAQGRQAMDRSIDSSFDRNNGLWEMYQQIEQLQNELQQLRGTVEEQAYQLNILQQQQKGQYLDLDQRINAVANKTAKDAMAPVSKAPTTALPMSEAQFKEEKVQYELAKEFVAKRDLENARQAFQALLNQYPKGAFTAYSHYWLGEIYMVLNEPKMEQAKTHFETVLSQYPSHPKEGATLYKLGKLYHLEGNGARAKELLNNAIKLNPGSRVAKLAEKYLLQIE